MDYEDSNNEFEEEGFTELTDEVSDFDEDVDVEEKGNKKSLKVRRSIEAYLDKKRVDQMHDYLIDDIEDDQGEVQA